ncbi:biotin transporter BioY [Ruminococcus flavefaciens]|uniref:Biotin transporter n=1 Tax=Ruminococcus flavefaciens 007c TaxID=1341157 RepID=W7UFT3_RUMFL|nr:biotin transporter BioY [Ruminococcus flavefaciens]EWM54036.1 hypothetical protein RF007C_03740 [Ruminococcus flavefaciens 007c]
MSESVTTKSEKKHFTTKEIVLTAMFAAIIAVCSWISIPAGEISFTLQTFAIFCALNILGGRNAFFSVLVFIFLGAVGLPVFTGFKGGVGVLVGPTGGYILGFLFMPLVYWLGTILLGSKLPVRIILMLAGLIVCYLFGTLWFVYGFSKAGNEMSFRHAMEICVIPFAPFDLLKLVFAVIITEKVRKMLKL